METEHTSKLPHFCTTNNNNSMDEKKTPTTKSRNKRTNAYSFYICEKLKRDNSVDGPNSGIWCPGDGKGVGLSSIKLMDAVSRAKSWECDFYQAKEREKKPFFLMADAYDEAKVDA
ncbi:hypothetical protein CEXT_90411 [Caerostris extrusa]|uniref:Uncharacterized protein n=1 Tax=Caerostris extrusa TaxID=172846 RepID=A0AAV4Y1S3_CAEEX|nr:hypothetical protein CEXT_90411 [Caerostris extrusa]